MPGRPSSQLASPQKPLPCRGPAYAADRELVTLEQAKQWWPFRPLLDGEPPGGLVERWYAASQRGGTAGDPREPREQATLLLLWESPRAEASRCAHGEVYQAGGLGLMALHAESREAAEKQWGPIGDSQQVRGSDGWYIRANTDDDDATNDIQIVRWIQPVDGGDGVLMWQLASHPSRYTRTTVVALANGLRG